MLTFRDVLAWFAFLIIIPFLWILGGLLNIELPESVIGATIVVWTLIGQFYFRKKGG